MNQLAVHLTENSFPHWRSLQRVHSFFDTALRSSKHIRIAGASEQYDCKVIFRLTDDQFAQLGSGPPVLLALHGSCVLDRDLVRSIILTMRECDGVIVSCESDVSILNSMQIEPMPHFILQPYGTSFSENAQDAHAHLKAILSIPNSNKIVTCISRLIPQKNCHVFIDFIRWINQFFPTTGLLIGDFWDDYPIGMPGPKYRHYLDAKDKTNNLIRFTGGFSDSELSLFLSGSDIVFHPSLSIDENFGFIPAESISCGTPVIACDYGGMKDTIRHGQTGWKAPTWITETGVRADIPCLFWYARSELARPSLRSSNAAQFRADAELFSSRHVSSELSQGVLSCYLSHKNGFTTPCSSVAGSDVLDRDRVRWAFSSTSAYWPNVAPSATHYVTGARDQLQRRFNFVSKFGVQKMDGNSVTVTDPTVDFAGLLTQDEANLLNSVGPDWQRMEDMHIEPMRRLLAAGILVGSTYHA